MQTTVTLNVMNSFSKTRRIALQLTHRMFLSNILTQLELSRGKTQIYACSLHITQFKVLRGYFKTFHSLLQGMLFDYTKATV